MLETLQDKEYAYLQKIGKSLKMVRSRQQIYSELLNFIKKNINSSSQQINQLTIFSQFVHHSLDKSNKIAAHEDQLYACFQENTCITTVPIKKELNRFCARLVEILDYSMIRTRESVVFTKNLESQHVRLKKDLNSMLNKDSIKVRQFLTLLWDHERTKYKNQIQKVEKYVISLETGDNIFFRSYYQTDTKKNEQKVSPTHGQNKIRSLKKAQKNSSSKSRQKSIVKPFAQKESDDSRSQNTESRKQLKNKTAYKLLKQYNVLQLSRKQFLQDMVFEQSQENQQKRKVFYNLWEKNKLNKQQIKQFSKQVNSVPNINKVLLQRAQSFTKPLDTQVTNEEVRESLNQSKKMLSTQRNNFIISRVRHRRDLSNHVSPLKTQRQQVNSDIDCSSFKIQQPQPFLVPQIILCDEFKEKQEKQIASEDKKPVKAMTPRPNRIYVVKNPVIFQNEALQIESQAKQRKYETPRFKRRTYQYPLNKSQISKQSFKLPF